MLKCSLDKNKSYPVENIFFNPSEKSYQLTLKEKLPTCPDGIFKKKNLEVKIIPDNQTPYLHFNKQDAMPELVVSSLSLVKRQNTAQSVAQVENHAQPMALHSAHSANFSFLYILLAGVAIFMLFRYFMKKSQEQNVNPFPAGNTPTYRDGYSDNVINYPTNNNATSNNNSAYGNGAYQNSSSAGNPYNNPNPYAQTQQGPSKTASFLSGLAGGALGAVVGNEIYDKLKGSDAHAAPSQQSNNSDFSIGNSFSSDDDDDSVFDNSDDDSFSSD